MWRRKRMLDELEEDIREHIERETQDNIARGMTPEEARYAARRKFGNVSRVKEEVREVWIRVWLEQLLQDVRYAFRTLRKSLGFTAIAMLTLGLGIGANTAIFSLINAVALRSLPVPNPQQLVLLQWTAKHKPDLHMFHRFGGCPSGRGDSSALATACSFSYPMFEQARSMRDIFSGVFSYFSVALPLRVGHPAGQARGMYVSGDFFSTLGAQVSVGRALNANDDSAGAEPVIVLSYRYWQSELGGDANVLGKTATLSLKPFRIVGITGRDFPDFDPGVGVDFWIPLAAEGIVSAHATSRTDEKALWLYALGRMKPGITAGRAEAELNAIFLPRVTSGGEAMFKVGDAPRIRVSSAAEGMSSLRAEYERPLYALMTVVGLILLLASANVAGLMLARSSARQKEMAVRNALGAPRSRIVRQLLTESLILSAAGGVLGVLLAELCARSLVRFLSANSFLPLQIDVGMDWRVLGFTLAVSSSVGILFGLAPALRDSRVDVAPALKTGGGSAGQVPRQSAHLSKALVVVQVVISMLVLVGAGLLARTVLNLKRADAGFRTENLLLLDVDMTASGLKIDDPRCDRLNEELQKRFADLPGVSSASYSLMPLLTGGSASSEFSLPGDPPSAAQSVDALPVGRRFFETIGIPLVEGRTFTSVDFESPVTPKPIVVNRSFAQRLFGKDDPVGRIVVEGAGPEAARWQVIGVVGDTRYSSIRQEVAATVFTPHVYSVTSFELRTRGDPKALAPSVREAVGKINPDYLILRMVTQQQEINRTIYQERLIASLSVLFGLLALTLASIGLYGLVAYGVSRRTHEIGVRMALGAERHEILWQMARLGVVLTLTGVAIGLSVAAGVTRYLQSFLYHVRPTDSWTFAGIAVLLMAVAAIGCFLPARRAMRVDPMVALRYE